MFSLRNYCIRFLRLGHKLPGCSGRNFVLQQNVKKIVCDFKSKSDHYSRAYVSVNAEEPDIAQLTGGNPELENKLRVIILEAEVMRQEGKNIPQNSFIKSHHWQELLNLQTKTARRKYLEFLFKVEKKKENEVKKKEMKKEERGPKPEVEDDGNIKYGLQHNHILLRVYDTTINQMYNNRLVQAMQFGQKLIVDCGYYDQMTPRENKNCAKQLMLLFAENRAHDDPFDLYFCNAVRDSTLIQALHRHIATMYEPWFPLNVHEESYLDFFEKEKLVYLTPHCREVLTQFNHDDVYIIGGIVDKVNNEPVSLAKAKKEGLRMAKFPLDKYLQWGSGSGKSLTLNQVASVLLDLKKTGDWNNALRHVPRRKLVDNSLGNAIIKAGSHLSYDKEFDKRHSWRPSATSDRLRLANTRNDTRNSKEKLVDIKNILKE